MVPAGVAARGHVRASMVSTCVSVFVSVDCHYSRLDATREDDKTRRAFQNWDSLTGRDDDDYGSA